MCVCVFVGISSRIYAFFFCKHKELFSFSQQITAVGPVPPLLCVCLCVGGCCLQETFARTTIVLFVCFYTFNVYLILFVYYFHTDLQSSFPFFRFLLLLVNRSMPSMILETQFSTCQQLFCFYSAFQSSFAFSFFF